MKVAEHMRRHVRSVGADASVADAVLTPADGTLVGAPRGGCPRPPHGYALHHGYPGRDRGARSRAAGRRAGAARPSPHDSARQLLQPNANRIFVTDGGRVVEVVSSADVVCALAKGVAAESDDPR